MKFNLQSWIDSNRHHLKPPVGNQEVWKDREFMVTVVGGPNSRQDFHYNEGEEFFYQIEGTMNLRMIQDGHPIDYPISAGEIYLLPPKVLHSPQRPAGSVGMVIERRRLPHEKDGLIWICEKCHEKLYSEFFHLKNLVTDLPPVFERFFGSKTNTVCKKCGHEMIRKQPA